MLHRKGLVTALLAAALTASLAGCEMFHDLQPYRLKRLNHGIEGMPASDYYGFNASPARDAPGYFASVPDPIGNVAVCRTDGD